MKIQNNYPNFRAHFSPYPHTTSEPKFFEMFRERTKKYPRLVLLQDDISYFGEDHFYLLKGNKVLAFGTAEYTRAVPDTLEGAVDKMVGIFNKLLKKADKKQI